MQISSFALVLCHYLLSSIRTFVTWLDGENVSWERNLISSRSRNCCDSVLIDSAKTCRRREFFHLDFMVIQDINIAFISLHKREHFHWAFCTKKNQARSVANSIHLQLDIIVDRLLDFFTTLTICSHTKTPSEKWSYKMCICKLTGLTMKDDSCCVRFGEQPVMFSLSIASPSRKCG